MRITVLFKKAPEATTVWFASCLSVLLAVIALLPTLPLRIAIALAGFGLSVSVAPAAVERMTPVAAIMLALFSACFTMIAVMIVSNASIATGLAVSRAGGEGAPGRWLFTSACVLFGTGLVPAARMVIDSGYSEGKLTERGHRFADALPVLSAVGWMVVGIVPVGIGFIPDRLHTQAAIVAMGAFWLGMVATGFSRGFSSDIRHFSRGASALVVLMWIPTELKSLGLIATSPVKTLYMQAAAAALSILWMWWVAMDWRPSTTAGDLTGGSNEHPGLVREHAA